MPKFEPFEDARIVSLYDQDNPDGPDREFYRALATRISAVRILDLGCGTGLLTRTLARPDRVVIGVDPSVEMLSFARRQPGADRVTWILGDAADLPGQNADLAQMTANVAQVFIRDGQWERTLRFLRGALRTGGTLAFETRNPNTGGWRVWTKAATFRRVETPYGPLTRWVDNIKECAGIVTMDGHYIFESTGEHLVSHGALRFRSAGEIGEHLRQAGFFLQHVYGDWQRGPLTASSPIMVFVATAQ